MRRFHKTEKGKQEGAFRRCFYPGRNEFTFVGQNDRHYKLKKNKQKKTNWAVFKGGETRGTCKLAEWTPSGDSGWF